MQTNTAGSDLETYEQSIAARDGIIRLWRYCGTETEGSAKIYRNGKTLARIDALTDGTYWCTSYADGAWGAVTRSQVSSWAVAQEWLTSQTIARILTA